MQESRLQKCSEHCTWKASSKTVVGIASNHQNPCNAIFPRCRDNDQAKRLILSKLMNTRECNRSIRSSNNHSAIGTCTQQKHIGFRNATGSLRASCIHTNTEVGVTRSIGRLQDATSATSKQVLHPAFGIVTHPSL